MQDFLYNYCKLLHHSRFVGEQEIMENWAQTTLKLFEDMTDHLENSLNKINVKLFYNNSDMMKLHMQ